MAQYYFPTDFTRARSVSIVPFGSGEILLPLWTGPESWLYTSASGLAVSGVYLAGGAYGAGNYGVGPYPNGPLGSMCGFGSACSDTSGNAWLAQYTGSLVYLLSGGTFNSYALPGGSMFVGTAFCTGFGLPYTVNNIGNIYTQSGTGVVFVGSYFPSGGAVYGTGVYGSGLYSSFALGVSSVWALACNNTTLYSFAPGTLESFNLTSSGFAGSGVPINAPIIVPTCLATSGNYVALGGWNQATLGSGLATSGIITMAFDNYNSNALALRPIQGRVDLYTGPSEVWSFVQSMSGITNPDNAAWDSNGVNAIVTDPVTGAVYGLTYALSTISITSTLSGITDASAVIIQPDDITAFVCQPTQNQVRQLDLIGTNWVTGGTFALSGASTLVTLPTASGVAVGYASGVAFLQGHGQSYSIVANVPLTYVPSNLEIDIYGNVLCVGSTNTLGVFTPFTGMASGVQINWAGSAVDSIYSQGQLVVLDSTNNIYRYFSQYSGGSYSQYNAQQFFVSGVSGIGIGISPISQNASGGTVFTFTSGGAGTVYQSQFVGPFNLAPIVSGVVGIFNIVSGTWTSTTPLLAYDTPTAIAFDTSGNIQVATRNNNLYEIATSGTIITSAGIPVYTGQTQTTPLGISAMMAVSGGHLWGASSLNGSLVELF